jgi:dolichol-phosphate mannosyltransferase
MNNKMINYLKKLKHIADLKYGNLSRLAQFCIVGASGMCVDLASYAAFLAVYIPLPLSRALAIWISMTWNFWVNRRVTFSYSRREKPLRQYFKFVSACIVGAIISWSISVGLITFVVFFTQHIFIAAIIGILVGTLSNFLTSLLWVFKKPVNN